MELTSLATSYIHVNNIRCSILRSLLNTRLRNLRWVTLHLARPLLGQRVRRQSEGESLHILSGCLRAMIAPDTVWASGLLHPLACFLGGEDQHPNRPILSSRIIERLHH